MFTCPSCNREINSQTNDCFCGADLTILQTLGSVADAWFNKAIESLHENQTGRALEWIAACCSARPDDINALFVLAKIWIKLNCIHEARNVFERIKRLEPDHSEIANFEVFFEKCDQNQSIK